MKTVEAVMTKFSIMFTSMNIDLTTWQTVRTEENIAAVWTSINNKNSNVSVNGARYRAMWKVEELDLMDMWFQQDSATCHTVRDTVN